MHSLIHARRQLQALVRRLRGARLPKDHFELRAAIKTPDLYVLVIIGIGRGIELSKCEQVGSKRAIRFLRTAEPRKVPLGRSTTLPVPSKANSTLILFLVFTEPT